MFRAFFNKMFSPPTQQTTAEGAAMVKEFCDGLIKSKPVVVFSKTYCPYCTKAKQALGELPLAKDALEVVELDLRPDCAQIQDYMKEITGGRSVPRVFIGGVFLGGGDDTVKALKDGVLKQKLAQAGALIAA